MTHTAAVLARGLGTRMRRADETAALRPAEAAIADSGVKGMIPIQVDANTPARPFLDFVLAALADVGVTDVVLVIGPEHSAVREHYTHDAPPTRVRVRFAIQDRPLGTANAVAVAADVIGDEPFLVLNADNFYPTEALRLLVQAKDAATVAFDREALVVGGNIERERVRSFAVLSLDDADRLQHIIEKPGERIDLDSDAARWVGMNCWRITPELASACRRVPRSSRGEFELPEAVALAIHEGVFVQAYRVALPVLDLSQRADIATVTSHLSRLAPAL